MEEMSIVESHNRICEEIRRASTPEEIKAVYGNVKDFKETYGRVDTATVDSLSKRFETKLSAMLEDNDAVYQKLFEKVNAINNREYDFTADKDASAQVQNKALQMMAKLPSARTAANTTIITDTLSKAINSGVIGSRAVLELLKYPAYAEMVSVPLREQAIDGSKTEEQRAYEKVKAAELRQAQKALAEVFSQGYRLRLLNKSVARANRPSVFSR